MVSLGELGFDITAEKAPTLRSGFSIKLNEDKEVKLRHLQPANESIVRFNAEGKWAIGCNLKTKDLDLEYRMKLSSGKLLVKQRIPRGQWELFPSPEFRLTTNPIQRGRVKDDLEVSYDLLTSQGRIEQRLDLDGRFQLRIRADATGLKGYPALVALSPRLNAYPFLIATVANGLARLDTSLTVKEGDRSLGIGFNKTDGVVAALKSSEFNKRVGLDASLSFKKRELWTALDITPIQGSKFKLTAEATLNQSGLTRPLLRLGARYEL